MKSDEHLIEHYNSGDLRAFDELYRRYKRPAYNYALRLSGSNENANDIYQSAWLKIIEKSDDFVIKIKKGDPPFVFKLYFFTMLRNAIFDKVNKESKNVELDDSFFNNESFATNSAESEVVAEVIIASLLSAIDDLPIQQKETFLLIKECGLSLKDVAEIQGISIETAKTRRRYAYEKLKPILESMK